MSLNVGELEATLKLKSDLEAQLAKDTRSLNSFSSSVGKIGAVIAGAFTAAKIVQFGVESIRSYSQQEDALVRLSAALKAQGTFTPALAAQYEALSAKFQQTTIYADDLTVEMMALLTQVGNVMPSEMEGALQAATNLASGLGIDLRAATMLVGKAFAGETGTLKRYGIVIDEASLKSGGATAVLKALNDQFGGQAQAQAATYSGQVAQLTNTWDDFKESVGKVLTGILLPMIPALKSAATWMQGFGSVVAGARVVFDSLLYAGLSTLKWLIDFKLKVLELTNAFGIHRAEIARLRTESAAYAAAIQGVVTEQRTVTAVTTASTGALRERIVVDQDAAKAAKEHTKTIQDLRDQLGGTKIQADVKNLAEAFRGLTPAERENQVVMEAVAAAAITLREAHGTLPPALAAVVAQYARLASTGSTYAFFTLPALIDRTAELREALPALTGNLFSHNIAFDEFIGLAPAVKKGQEGITAALAKAQSVMKVLGSSLGGLNDIFQRAFEGGGGILGAIKSYATNVGRGLLEMIPVVGPFISQFAGSIVAGFSKLFGGVEKEVNKTRETFVQAAGGLGALNLKAAEAGTTLTAMLNAKNPEQYKKAIDDLNAAFEIQKQKVAAVNTDIGTMLSLSATLKGQLPADLQAAIDKLADMKGLTQDNIDAFKRLSGNTDVDFKQMQETARTYGIDLAALGPQFQSARLHDAAATIINDFDVLTRGGADVGGVLFGMREEISHLVTDSLKFGVEIPANMQPWIEELARSGNLVDENGKKITDLSGLKFAPPIVTEFQKIVDKIQELIDKIGTTLPGVIANIPDPAVDVTLNAHWKIDNLPKFQVPDLRGAGGALGGLVTASGIQHLAEGGRVLPFLPRSTDTVPAMLTPGEGVVTTGGMQQLGVEGLRALNRGGGGDSSSVVTTLDNAGVERKLMNIENELRWQRHTIPIAIRDALQRSRAS